MCESDMCSLTVEISDAVVVGLWSRKACIDRMNDTVGICSLVQKISRCPSKLSGKLVIGDPENALHTFTAFQNTIRKITGYN